MSEPQTGRVAFLGPEGTFTEEALLANLPAADLHPYPYPSIREVLLAVQRGEARLGLVPIENSLEGSVAVTLDLLAWGFEDLRIVREIVHPVRHQLIARGPLELDKITKVISHPHAYGQCRSFLTEHLPNVEHEAANSTADAVRTVSRVDRPWAAIGTRLAAEMYECAVVRDDIEDSVENRTRFVFLSRETARRRRGDLQDQHRLRHRPGRARQPAADPVGVRLPSPQPDEGRVAAVEAGPRSLHLLHRLRGSRRRRPGRAGAQVPRLQAALAAGPRLVPRLTPAVGDGPAAVLSMP